MKKPRLVLAVSGSIAGYKAPLLARAFQERGLDVKMAATHSGSKFITDATVHTLTGSPLFKDVFYEHRGDMEHISLADWADLYLVAPATANIIAKFAAGIADDLVSTLFLSVRCPTLIAPAMNEAMWAHPTVSRNMQTLKAMGARFCDPGEGYLACGISGHGRLADLDKIVSAAMPLIETRSALSGKKALVTAGGTREAIDPVRCIANRSSGRMGYAAAEALRDAGVEVTLISGPSALAPPAYVKRISVESAQEMFEAVKKAAPDADVIVKAAAVADFRPVRAAESKIKKGAARTQMLELERTPDILEWLGKNKKKKQLLVGFAAETNDHLANAKKKFESKNLDILALNDVSNPEIGFDSEDNALVILKREKKKIVSETWPRESKKALANKLADLIARAF